MKPEDWAKLQADAFRRYQEAWDESHAPRPKKVPFSIRERKRPSCEWTPDDDAAFNAGYREWREGARL